MESLESQLHSSTSGTQSNSLFLGMSTHSTLKKEEDTSKENVCIVEFLSKRYCNGVIGVPITYLDKHCPNQFRLPGISIANSPLMTKHYSDYVGYKQNGIPTGRTR